MHAVRDPRFKGSDASNIHDEEVGEDEMEWSDDEMEAEAKRRRKERRGGSAAPRGGKRSAQGTPLRSAHGLPDRPHFDFQPTEDVYAGSETGSMYGDDEERSVYGSEAGSSSGRERRPVSYDDLEDGEMASEPPRSGGRGRGDRGRGRGTRGQNREGGRGRGRGRGGGRNGNRLPPRPETDTPQQLPPIHYPFHQTQPMPTQQYQPSPYPVPIDSYHPNQPYQPTMMGFVPQEQQQQYYPQAQFQGQQPQYPIVPQPYQPTPGVPAINPRFGSQYPPSTDSWHPQQNHPYSQ